MAKHFSILTKIKLWHMPMCQSFICRVSTCLSIYLLLTPALYAQEHIQFHTDRTYYFPGDTVWYKAYLMYHGAPDMAVRNLGVAIGRPDRQIVEQQLRPVIKGATFGQYVIPRDYADHELYFNLYSRRYNTSGTDAPHAAKVGIYQNKKVLSDIRPAVKVSIDGGGLLSGMPSRTTFQWNVHTPVHGTIRDQDGAEVKELRSDSQGRAETILETNQTPLFLHWSFQGKDYIDALPVCTTGARLRLVEMNDSTFLLVENRSDIRSMTLKFRDDVETRREKTLDFGADDVRFFPVEEMLEKSYSGDFLLVHADSILAHLRLDHYLNVVPEVAVEQIGIDPYGTNELDILIPGHGTWNLSISIHDGLLPALSDAIGDPTYERSGKYRYTYPPDERGKALQDDVLTLTGRINMLPTAWDKFLQEKEKRQQKLAKEKKAMKGISFGYRLSTEADFRYEEVQYDTTGNLLLPDITFYDTLQTRVVQIDDRLKIFDYDMEWRYSNLEPLERLTIPDLVHGIDLTHYYSGRFDPDYYTFPSGDQIIKEVEVSRKQVDPRIRKMQQQYSRGWFDRESVIDIDLINEDIPDWVFTLDELSQYLANKYPVIHNAVNMNKPIVLANNTHLTDAPLQGGHLPIDVTEIVFVRVYENYIISPLNPSGRGAIMYYSSGINARNKDIGVAKIKLAKIPGYSGFLDFHHRDYTADSLPEYDDRQTLYWNPDVQIKGGVRLPIRFYNNSMSDSYTITIQGMSSTGRTLRFSKRITKEGM